MSGKIEVGFLENVSHVWQTVSLDNTFVSSVVVDLFKFGSSMVNLSSHINT